MPNSNQTTNVKASAMQRPDRFMARGLAEAFHDGKASIRTCSRRPRRIRRQRRWWPQRTRRFAPGAGIAARDHPVDETCDNPGAGHDFEVPPDDAVEAKRCRIERHKAEIADKTDHTTADGVGQHAPDVERLGDGG